MSHVLELELLAAVSEPCGVGVGNQTPVPHQSLAALNCQDISVAPGQSLPVTQSNQLSHILILAHYPAQDREQQPQTLVTEVDMS